MYSAEKKSDISCGNKRLISVDILFNGQEVESLIISLNQNYTSEDYDNVINNIFDRLEGLE